MTMFKHGLQYNACICMINKCKHTIKVLVSTVPDIINLNLYIYINLNFAEDFN